MVDHLTNNDSVNERSQESCAVDDIDEAKTKKGAGAIAHYLTS